MFIKTVSASEFRENIKENLELVKDENILQMLHRGNGVKVIMTQEYFFNVLQKSKLFDDLEKRQSITKIHKSNTKKTITKEELLKMTKQKSNSRKDKVAS